MTTIKLALEGFPWPWIKGERRFATPPASQDRQAGLQGEDLERLSLEPGVSSAGLCRWRGYLTAGRADLDQPPQDGRGLVNMRWRRLKRAAFVSRGCQRRQMF